MRRCILCTRYCSWKKSQTTTWDVKKLQIMRYSAYQLVQEVSIKICVCMIININVTIIWVKSPTISTSPQFQKAKHYDNTNIKRCNQLWSCQTSLYPTWNPEIDRYKTTISQINHQQCSFCKWTHNRWGLVPPYKELQTVVRDTGILDSHAPPLPQNRKTVTPTTESTWWFQDTWINHNIFVILDHFFKEWFSKNLWNHHLVTCKMFERLGGNLHTSQGLPCPNFFGVYWYLKL